ncbi:hypothetical protein [Moorena sp. SIO4A5]|nr:hypothetical protein [Moorena sp. SIO4A5]
MVSGQRSVVSGQQSADVTQHYSNAYSATRKSQVRSQKSKVSID